MPGSISQGALAASQIVAPGLYVQILPPPSNLPGVATNVGWITGSAAWGPVGVPVFTGNPNDVGRNFGPVPNANAFTIVPGTPIGTTLPATANKYDMVSEALAIYTQVTSRGGCGLWMQRAIDGNNYAQGGTPGAGGSTNNTTGAYASLALVDTIPVAGLTLYGLYMGTLGNGITITIALGSKGAGFYTVTVNPPGGLGMSQEVYPNIPSAAGSFNNVSYAGLFWPTLASYLLNGIPGGRGPSLLLYAYLTTGTGFASTTAAVPAVLTNVALTGGVDGCTFVTSGFGGTNNLPVNMIGSSSAVPATGLYTIPALNPSPAAFRIAGFGEAAGDVTSIGANVAALATAAGSATFIGFPIGDDSATATATAAVVTNGIDNWEVIYVKDHAYWNDGTSGPRFFPMAPFAMGNVLTQQPQNSPLNTAIQGILGTYRDVSTGAPANYSNAEIGLCNQGRISLIAKPCPGGIYEGFNTAVNSSSNTGVNPIEYTTLTNYIAKALAGGFGRWVGQLQSGVNPQDLTRDGVQSDLNTLMAAWVTSGTIAAGFAQCDLNNNSKATIAAHYLFAAAQATYLASVWYFLLSFTGGTTVQVQVAQGAQA